MQMIAGVSNFVRGVSLAGAMVCALGALPVHADPAPQQSQLPTPMAGEFVSGNFGARVRSAVISRTQANVATMTLSIELFNLGEQPVGLTLLSTDWLGISAQVDNGITPSTRTGQGSNGIPICVRPTPAECRSATPEVYLQIDPKGRASVNSQLIHFLTPEQTAVFSDARSAQVSFRIHLLDGSKGDRIVQVSLSDVPVRVVGG